MAPVRFPSYRAFERARIASNDAMMALLIGSRLGSHTLQLAEGSPHLLGTLFPAVPEAGRLNRSVEDARGLIDEAERHLTFMAVPYALAVYGGLLSDSISLLRLGGLDARTDEPRDIPLSEIHCRLVAAAGEDLTVFPAIQLRLFGLARWMRNRIVHRGGTAGSRLPIHYRQELRDVDRAEWQRIAKRDPPFGSGSDEMDLRSGELRAVLAVTKHLAEAVNGLLKARLPLEFWSLVAVDDYEEQSGRRAKGRVGSVLGFARMYYSGLEFASTDIEIAIATRLEEGGRSTD